MQLALGRTQSISLWDDGDPIRSELFSVERLEQHAESLAADQLVSAKPPTARSLVDRLADNERVLLGAYRSIAKAADEGRPITPAAEWLLDNYHLVEQQVREVRTDLPPGYYRQLPKLRSGPLAGYPRVFGVAWAFVAHTDSRFDPEALTRFVRAYQTVQPLSIGELWAVAITLRIVLMENLRRSAVRIMSRRSAREEADSVADRLMGVNDRVADPAALSPYQRVPFSEGFFVQLVQRLRDQDPEATPAVGWLQEQLKREGTTADEMVRREHQLQGATNVTVRNIITSMRLISDVDWAKLFEAVSPVDDVLRAGSDFAAMDFATRNLYRTAIEQIARGPDLAEMEIARRALETAASSPDTGDGDRRRGDPGYHLIGGGRPAFERSVRFRPSGLALRRRFAAAGIAGYVASVSFAAAVVLFLPLLVLAQVGLTGWQGAVQCDIQPTDTVAIWGCGPRSIPRCCWSIGRSPAASARCSCPASSSGRVCRLGCVPSSPSRRCCRLARPSTSSFSGSRCTISPILAGPCISRSCRTGRTPTRRPTLQMPTLWRWPSPVSSGSTAAIRMPKVPIVSSCFTGVAPGTRRRAAGWDGSASAASSRNSTACCAVPPTPASSIPSAT